MMRILLAIQLVLKWSSAVSTPEKTISAMGSGDSDVIGGGEFGGNNGWSYSLGYSRINFVNNNSPQVSPIRSTILQPAPSS
jgi:hypothetical protein